MSLRDRNGEPLDPDRRTLDDHLCRRGWLGEDSTGTPRPCLLCRPWLRYRRPPTRAELAAFEARHPRPARSTP